MHHWCSLTVVLVSLVLVQSNSSREIGAENSTGHAAITDPEDSYPALWISDLFYKALYNFTVRNVGSTACRTQVSLYERNLRNYTSWAVRMAESWDRQPVGILGGNKYHMGSYYQCVNVQQPIKGQYCLSEIKLFTLTKKNYSYYKTEDWDDFGSNHAWNIVLGWVDSPYLVQRNVLNIGICIPSSCSALDLETSLQKELDNVFIPERVRPVVKIDPLLCTVSEDTYPYDTGFYVTSSVLVVLILLCSITTIYHIIVSSSKKKKEETNKFFHSYFYSFSLIKSSKDLIKYDNNNELNALNGIKTIIMFQILYGHRLMLISGNPISYSKFEELIYYKGPKMLLTGMNFVDPFFFISGYLMIITVTPIFRKNCSLWIQFISPIIYRLLRMLPAYCLVIAIVAFILPHLGNGPFWPQKIWFEAENCKNYWWANLLFINNYIDSKYQCLLVSWYISCDIQFFIIGVAIVYVYTKSVKYCIWLLGVLLSISLFVPFIVIFLTKSDGILKVGLSFVENPRINPTFNLTYRQSYMRAVPFIWGLIVSIIIKTLNENKIKFSNKTVYVVTFIVVVISTWIQFYGTIFYTPNRPYNPLEHALYATLSHCTHPMVLSVFLIFNFTTGYGPLTNLISNRYNVLFGRLSYSVFLVNLIEMVVSQSTQILPYTYSKISTYDAWIYDSFKTYLLAIALYLIVEAPFGNLTRILFGRGSKGRHSNAIEIQVEKPIDIESSKF